MSTFCLEHSRNDSIAEGGLPIDTELFEIFHNIESELFAKEPKYFRQNMLVESLFRARKNHTENDMLDDLSENV